MEETTRDNQKRERITSPDRLDSYLQVTKPSMWIVIGAVLAIVIAFIVWGSVTTVDAEVKSFGSVTNGTLICPVDDTTARIVKEGQKLVVEGVETEVEHVTKEGEESVIRARISIADGLYSVRIIVDDISPIQYLFN